MIKIKEKRYKFMTPMEIIEARHSVRQYKTTSIEPEKREILDRLCSEINEQSGMNIQIIYDEPECFNSRMAHYGKFSNVGNYISVVGPKDKELDEKAGFYGEQLVLKAQELGLNTCWAAMTHGKSKAIVGKGEKEAIVISLGYGENQGVAHKNKELSTLAVVSDSDPDWYKDGVKAALLAPTAVNQQKFFIELAGENAKITAPKGMLTKLDLGIVKYNFEFASGHKTI